MAASLVTQGAIPAEMFNEANTEHTKGTQMTQTAPWRGRTQTDADCSS
jgi:hypothetical protein